METASPRKARAMEISARLGELRSLLPNQGLDREVRAAADRERSALLTERRQLLAEVEAALEELRPQQAHFDRIRGRQKKRRPNKAELRLRAKIAALASERALLDGTADTDRELAKINESIFKTTVAMDGPWP